MQIYQYPNSISYFGGGSYSGQGGGTNDGHMGNFVATWNDANAGALNCNIVAGDPNGVNISRSASASAIGSANGLCWGIAGDSRGGTVNNSYNGQSVWAVGQGYSEDVTNGATHQNLNGDLNCFGVNASGYDQYEFNNNYGVTKSFVKMAWPREKIFGKTTVTHSNATDAYTQLAQGYFTGPPTYKTTGNKWAFTIKSKTSLVWSNYVTDITILVGGPHTTQKSMPEHFFWVAGGVNPCPHVFTRAKEYVNCYYDFRADFDNSYGRYIGYVHPNYRKLINSTKLNMSSSVEKFTLNGVAYSNQFSSRLVTNAGGKTTFKDLAGYASTDKGWVYSAESSTKTTGWKNTNTGYDDDEQEPWPIIDTERTVANKVVWTTTFGGNAIRVGQGVRPVYTASQDEDGSYFLSTAMGQYEVGYNDGIALTVSNKTSNAYTNYTRIVTGAGATEAFGKDKDYYITDYKEFGIIHRKHETSKRGYYFTDPDIIYKCATDVGTDYDVNTFLCHDATCIDIKRYANAQIFQTAKTYNNSLVIAKLKSPRNTSMAMSDTISLESVQNYFTYQTEETRIWDTRYDSAPIWGHPKYKKNEYGEDASYSYSGFTTTTVDQTATRLIPVSNTMHADAGIANWYDAGAYKWFYNPYQNPNRI